MPEYRRKKWTAVWHWRRDCSNWPTGRPGVDYDTRDIEPTPGELDKECLAKDKAVTAPNT
jgi:hypothetical protein